MSDRDLLMIPGPTIVDPVVLRSMAKPTVSHTGSEFVEIMRETIGTLGKILQTSGVTLPIAGSGTLGSEVALANILEP